MGMWSGGEVGGAREFTLYTRRVSFDAREDRVADYAEVLGLAPGGVKK
jgi:hypothetical protein